MNYAQHISTKVTPQSEPIPGTAQMKNSAGGFSYGVDDWARLDRFLVLGSEGGTYYAGERELTIENAKVVERLLTVDGPRVVRRIVEISKAGRAPKNDPAIFALAVAMKKGDLATRGLAGASVGAVCRIGTHLFQLAEAVKHLGGWGRNTKHAFATWYLNQEVDRLAMNIIKYQQRNGWSHRDILRKSHPKTTGETLRAALIRYATGKPIKTSHGLIEAFELAQALGKQEAVNAANTKAMVQLIELSGLPRECIPTQFLNSPDVWHALLHTNDGMPMTAMIRNLGKMTAVGLLKPLSNDANYVRSRLTDRDALKAARVHPLQVLLAAGTYGQGHGDKGKLSWAPVQEVVQGLDDAFVLAFDAVEPTGKRIFTALDVSSSMDGSRIAGSTLSAREASIAMALVTARTEQRHHVGAFSIQMVNIEFQPKATLRGLVNDMRRIPFGGTDCAQPMLTALKEKLEVDAFVVMTDSETWAGGIHASQALNQYRQKTGINAKLIVVGMTSNGFTIADPNDAGSLDVVGFDSATPAVMADFIRG